MPVFIAVFCVFFALIPPLFAQVTQNGASETSETVEETENDNNIYIIRDISFNVTGRSRPYALEYHGELREGDIIEGRANLLRYINEKTQLLYNQRVIHSINIKYTLGTAMADGKIPVDLLITVVDSWNIIALPRPVYDSTSGFEFSLRGRDYNFLGTMSPLRVNFEYEHRFANERDSSRDRFELEAEITLPFSAFGFNWAFDFNNYFSYNRIGNEEFFGYKNSTGLSVEFPLARTVLTAGAEQNFIVNEENSWRFRAEYGDIYAPFYMRSRLFTNWRIPLGVDIYNFGELTYTPEVSFGVNYRVQDELEYWRKGPDITLGHRLGFNRVDWHPQHRNYRSGAEVFLNNANTYNFYRGAWSNNYGLEATLHTILAPRLGFSGRFQFRQWFLDKTYEAPGYPAYHEVGGVLRGIVDRSVIVKDGGFMFSLNLDFPIYVMHFAPSEWFKDRRFRFFDFDMHFSPFFDSAMINGSRAVWGENGILVEEETTAIPFIPFSVNGMIMGGGAEIIIFPLFMRALYLRVSIGYNMNHFLRNFRPSRIYGDEIFIGIGHHY